MKKRTSVTLILVFIIFIIGYLLFKTIFLDTKLDGVNPLSINLIKSQIFTINSQRDTIVEGEKGTIIKIEKNSFSNCQGEIINGEINLELKEIFSTKDIILSGLTTTSDESILESGGMLYINAYVGGKKVCINDSNELGVIVPLQKEGKRMMLFAGKKLNDKVDWISPTPFLNDTIIITKAIGSVPDALTESEAIKLGIVTRDTIIIVGGDTIMATRNIEQVSNKPFLEYFEKYNNEFEINGEIHKVFTIKQFGYYNIDRFMEENKTDNIKLSTKINNINSYSLIFVKIALLDKQVFLDGYQNQKGKFVFGKGNTDLVGLPIGEKAVIFATTHYKNKPYFAFKKFTISKEQNIELDLKRSSIDKITNAINSF